MYTHYRRTISFVILAAVVLISTKVQGVHAQTVASSTDPSVETPFYGIPKEMTSCFDFYTYGSVTTTLTPSLSSVSTGAPISVAVLMKNNNDHPIIDAQLIVRVVRILTDEKTVSGPDVIEDIVPFSDLSFKAGEEKSLQFVWQSPAYLPTGNYAFLPYVQSAERFNLEGLSFTVDVTGAEARFEVVGEKESLVKFDTTNITFDGAPYQIIGLPPEILPQTKGVPVVIPIINDTPNIFRGTITWSLYAWDGINVNNLISKRTEDVALHPRSERALEYLVADAEYPIYYLHAVLTDESGVRSSVGVRFIRLFKESARMNDLGVDSYPVTKDSKAYVCMQELLSAELVPDIRSDAHVELILSKKGSAGGEVILKKEYHGKLSPELAALPFELTALEGELTDFDLTGRITLDGKIVDEVTLTYDCKMLGAPCPTPPEEIVAEDAATFNYKTLLIVLVGAAVTGFAILALFVLRVRAKSSQALPLE